MPPKGCPMPEEAREKIRQSRIGKRHSPETIRKISSARNKQNPPNLRHGRQTKQAEHKNLELKATIGLLKLLELEENTELCVEYVERYETDFCSGEDENSNQIGLYNSNISSFLESFNKYRDSTNPNWLECSLFIKEKEQGKDPLEWLKQARNDFNLNLNFSLSEVKELQDQKIEELKSNPDNPWITRKHAKSIRRLARIFEDAARYKNQGEPVVLFKPHYPIDKHLNYQLLLKLKVVLDVLGLKKEIDRRQYIKGVFSQKKLPKRLGRKFIPLRVLSSPLCIIDFLAYLKENWYERHAFSNEENKEEIRQIEYGQDYYMAKANLAASFYHSMIDSPNKTRFSSEFWKLSDIEECAWYLFVSPMLRPFYRRGLLKKGRPPLHQALLKIEELRKEDGRLREMLELIKEDSERLWKASGIPTFGEEDEEAIDFAFGFWDEQAGQKAKTLYRSLRKRRKKQTPL